ncbi:MAG: beta-galactosidase [Puniceicoccaceae bacterium]
MKWPFFVRHHRISSTLIFGAFLTGFSIYSFAEPLPVKGTVNQEEENPFPYTVRNVSGTAVEEGSGFLTASGENGFRLVLFPESADIWNFQDVSVLGVEFRNTGESDLVIDMRLRNEGATTWSNSAVGRTIIKAGEAIPLGIVLWRGSDYATTDSAYIRMSGKPNGKFRHWHKFYPERVKNLLIEGSCVGPHSFEIGRIFPIQEMKPELMGKFPFIDEFGQYLFKDWPGKVRSGEDIRDGIEVEQSLVAQLGQTGGRGKYGGWKEGPKLEATGFFRTEQYEGRWWFVDPEGYLFWSFGANCVGVEFSGQTPTARNLDVFAELPQREDPEFGQFYIEVDVEDQYKLKEAVPHYDFSRANLYRKYGKDWEARMLEQEVKRLHYTGLNTIGAWSDNNVVETRETPYTAIIHFGYASAAAKLPDPFDPRTRTELRKAIEQYRIDFANDPWCLGVFVNNELHWQNDAPRLVKVVLGFTEKETAAKRAFQDWLKNKYSDLDALNTVWKTDFSNWNDLLGKVDGKDLAKADKADCSALATLFAETYFGMVDEELAAVAPNMLYFGSRFNAGSNEVIHAAAKYVDVISANFYGYVPDVGAYASPGKPVLISEYHFANVGGCNLGSGLRSAQDSVQQARLFKSFIRDAVNHKSIVGAHWFQWRDQNVGGRYDGENYDVGYFDVADLPKEDLIRASREVSDSLYEDLKQ